MKKKSEQQKRCGFCGANFFRPYKYSETQWEKARFCSRSCRATLLLREKWASPAYREMQKLAHTGYVMPLAQRKRIGASNSRPRPHKRGANAPIWKGGISLNKKEYKRVMCRKRRAAKFNALGTHTANEWEELKAAHNHTCLRCGKREPEVKITEDHIVPLSKGGTDYIENIQPLCSLCNSQKLTKAIDWIRKISFPLI